MSAMRSDAIFLRGLAVECIIGFIEWERRVKQTVVIDLELPVDCARAALTDEVADTLDYKKLAKRVIAIMRTSGPTTGTLRLNASHLGRPVGEAM